MKDTSYEFIKANLKDIQQIDTNKSYGRVDLAFKAKLEKIGSDECWNYCRNCNSGFIRLVQLCLENYYAYEKEIRQRKFNEGNPKKHKGRPKNSVHN